MKEQSSSFKSNLRQTAEDRLQQKTKKTFSQLGNDEVLKLIHELQVHEIELELQNEELNQAYEDAKILAAKYTELFHFAPMGYFTLSNKGEILDLNLSGAKMLGKVRQSLVNSQFGFFVSTDTKPVFNQFIHSIFSSKTNQTCNLIITPENQLPVHVRLSGISAANQEQCLMTLTDLTIEKQAEEILRTSEKILQTEVKIRTLELKNSNNALKNELLKRKTSEKQLKKALNDFKNLYAYVLNVREEERNNIARIIHDDLAQLLTTLKMELISHNGKTGKPDFVKDHSFDSILQLLNESISSVTSVIKELRPVILRKLGLIPALKQLFSDFQDHTGISCDFRILEGSNLVKNELALPIFRIVQEGLANIRLHSKASYITVKISENPTAFSLTMKDNGRGITPEEISDPGSFGIIGMKERIAILGGKITFKGTPGKGTTIKLRVPLKS